MLKPAEVALLCGVFTQAWVDMISFIMGASLFAVFVGIITSVLISIDSISSGFYQKMEIVNQYMAHRKLPLDLRQRIRDSMDYKWRTRRALDEVRRNSHIRTLISHPYIKISWFPIPIRIISFPPAKDLMTCLYSAPYICCLP
jgi:hypothetical protein